MMLPEACVANILSFTTPADTFSSAAVSSVFQIAGDSDFVWEKFLPFGYSRVISRSTHRSFSSKKKLYRCLCESILIDNGRKVPYDFHSVEIAHGGRRGSSSVDRYSSSYSGSRAPSRRSDYRVLVTGLPPSASWQDLKDHMRKAGDVCFSEVFRERGGIVDYSNYDDMKYAVRKLDDTEFRNAFSRAYIRVREYESRSVSRSPYYARSYRSTSRSRGQSYSYSSRSRSVTPARSVSPRSRSLSRSPTPYSSVSRSRSISRSNSPVSPVRSY